jgi:hypothetical protein
MSAKRVEEARADELVVGDEIWCGEGFGIITDINAGEREGISGRMKSALLLQGDDWGIEPMLPGAIFLRVCLEEP